MASGGAALGTWDILAIVVYVLLVIGVSVYSVYRANRGTVNGYFLAGRFMTWIPVGASLFASNIGSEHFIGMAGSGAAAGIGVGAFNFNSIVLLQLLGWIFLPVYIASGVYTLPEYMTRRFGGQRIRIYLAVLSLILYIFTKISVNLYSGAIFIQEAVQWSIYGAIALLLGLTAVGTALGGLTAVIYTDTLQFVIMIAGSLYVMIKALDEVGGWSELQRKYFQAIPTQMIENSTCGIPREDSWIMLRDPLKSDIPWPAFLLGQTPATIWYWCADQMMVQRVLAARSLSHAQGGTLFAGWAKVLPFFLLVIPGMASRVLYPDEVACVVPEQCMKYCGSENGCTNNAYPRLILGIMPEGMRGAMMAVMLAALMSDLSSIFNSASTLFTLDLWRRIRPQASSREILIVGKLFVVFLVIVSVVWVPIIQELQGGQMYIYIQSISAYLAPPIAAVYCLAIFWKRTNEKGAFWGLMAGLLVGGIRMVLNFLYKDPRCYETDDRPFIIGKIHFMWFAMLLFWLTLVVAIIISLLTEPCEDFRVIRTTYWTRMDQTERQDSNDENSKLEKRTSTQTTFTDEEKAISSKLDGVNGDLQVDITASKTSETTASETSSSNHIGSRVVAWLIGKDYGEQSKPLEQNNTVLEDLKQPKKEKLILNINLFLIIAATIGIYIYFCISPFSTEEIQLLQQEALEKIRANSSGYEL
ncbi:sodium/mannose cotransporter SLC5A10-like isoform X2 [Artemia franciscana]|uniref:Sodium/myo-inositol cotransporter n=1 Tax=Artemia franciscana TaxID=6661 RepID=A0AA88HZQ7_ARTSF|nr:hypothetical protein QYM36_009569 [Artemia franciscana]